MTQQSSGIASAEDVRKLAEQEAYDPPVELTMPKSGLKFVVRRPRPIAYALVGIPLPETLAAKIFPADPDEQIELTREEQIALFQRRAKVTAKCFVEPRASLNPGPGEFDPRWLSDEDKDFLTRFIGGEVSADGADLGTFRDGAPAQRPAAGSDGGPVASPPVATAPGQPG
jgi:hypothetical protein